jgi:hypothetical protein
MRIRRKRVSLNWLKGLLRTQVALPPEILRAKEVIAAVDAGGIPLNPGKINEIARNLGLEVSRKAPVEDTVRRIRAAVERGARQGS